ncbi:putative leucine-rich repeat receptor-like serine/threonine-protein kinase [Platanthera guangdongensis]|uniref:Leucine-rich repeat receptor-like serine/threonine-protein kinase n=1 Tax=Platanthera guangdongensis TaxID=2320717 RepID=A0ABR2MH22_9ASPA
MAISPNDSSSWANSQLYQRKPHGSRTLCRVRGLFPQPSPAGRAARCDQHTNPPRRGWIPSQSAALLKSTYTHPPPPPPPAPHVHKGILKNETIVAIKVLSSESLQAGRELLTEITAISDIIHENLVELYGCCIEGNHRILVYNYLENNSLAQTLLGTNRSNILFSWGARCKICIGIARGLAFLHDEVHPHVLHRDIKASNILLDKDLTPKISDFGLARLLPTNATHISTRVAGTL